MPSGHIDGDAKSEEDVTACDLWQARMLMQQNLAARIPTRSAITKRKGIVLPKEINELDLFPLESTANSLSLPWLTKNPSRIFESLHQQEDSQKAA